jgi:hypothetical protein
MEVSFPRSIIPPCRPDHPGRTERDDIFAPTEVIVILRVASAIALLILLRIVARLIHQNIEALDANCPAVSSLATLEAILPIICTPY